MGVFLFRFIPVDFFHYKYSRVLVPLIWIDVGLFIGTNLNKEDRASPSGGKYLGLVEEQIGGDIGCLSGSHLDRYHLLVFRVCFQSFSFHVSRFIRRFSLRGFLVYKNCFFFIVVLKSCIIFEGAGNTLMVPFGWELIILYSLRQHVNLPNGVQYYFLFLYSCTLCIYIK